MEELDPAFLQEETVHDDNNLDFLENESFDHQFSNDSFHSTSFGSNNHFESVEDSHILTTGSPSRRGSKLNGNGNAQNGNRLSLAFELENVSGSASRSSMRDILAELGIDEVEEDEGEEDDYDSEVEEEERLTQQQQFRLHDESDEQNLLVDQPHIDRYKLSPCISISSTSSCTSISHPPFESPSRSSTPPSNFKDDLDVSFPPSISASDLDLGSTSAFLRNLRQHTNPDQHHLLSSSTTTSNPSTVYTVSTNESSFDYSDRQPFVEKLATSLIDRLYEFSRLREEQVKELVEMEKLANKNDLGWQKALGLAEEFDEKEGEIVSIGSSTFSSSNSTDSVDDSTRNFPLSSTSTIRNELANLREVTSTLISALTSLNELAQVNQAASGESARKLKSLKTHLGIVREEVSLFTRAEKFVKSYEEKEMEIPAGIRRREIFSTEARECMKGVEDALEEGWKRGSNIFQEVV